jgi:hypothetical protein
MTECVVCYGSDNLITTICCSQAIHNTCLNRWLNKSNSNGKCPFCRAQLRPIRGLPDGIDAPDGQDYLQSRWNNPVGYIDITSGEGTCTVNVELNQEGYNIPNTYICSYSEMETHVSDGQISDGCIIILTNGEGEYFDALNIPPGWALRVNSNITAMQLSAWLRME